MIDLQRLDALIAEYFFGWSDFREESGPAGTALLGTNPLTGNRSDLYDSYSMNGSDMLDLIEKLNELGWWVHLRSPVAGSTSSRTQSDRWRAVCGGSGRLQFIRDAETGPEAVARVALAAIGIDA